MRDRLIREIEELFLFLGSQKGKLLTLTDQMTTLAGNFDLHFTTTTKMKFPLDQLGVRFSGGVGFLEGEGQCLEFRTAAIRSISKEDRRINIDINIKDAIFRRIEIIVSPD